MKVSSRALAWLRTLGTIALLGMPAFGMAAADGAPTPVTAAASAPLLPSPGRGLPDSASHSPAVASAAPPQVLVMLRTPPGHARVDGSYGGGYADAAREQAQARIARRLAGELGGAIETQWPMPALGMDCVVLNLPRGASIAASIAALQQHGEVAWAQPVNEFAAQGHADPLYPLQPAARAWHLDDLHALATGRHVTIALVDSGVETSHPDLARAVETSANFVDDGRSTAESHGTALAGVIAARADNGIGLVGIAPDARIMALRACWEVDAQHTLCNSVSLAKALTFAIDHHADIINMSLSGPIDPLVARLIDLALARRLQVVAAVDARTLDGGFPADHPGVVAVADDADSAPPGAWGAPSRDLPATAPGGGFRMVTGSSFGAGEVSGLLALLQQIGDTPADAGGRLVRTRAGGIDACASLMRMRLASAGRSAGAELPSSACETVVAAKFVTSGP
ncbi:MAG TPA: S8 family serine peptidase [Burkholderiaceae bacterium]|nr:S8 family serine peptidase [Burkholderiaceae bacterium]